jgi:hypothetical protein
MPKDAPRQRPVSCRFCRSRKLRCSREAPCGNWVSRGIHCDLEAPVRPSSGARSLSVPERDLVERIRRLEELVESQKSQLEGSVKHHSTNSNAHTPQTRRSTLSPQLEHVDNDAAWLESLYTGQDLSVALSVNIVSV